MKQNDFLRFALVLSDGQAKTFNKNLEKLITLVLFDCYGKYITAGEIARQIKEKYKLVFLPLEIEDVISSSKKCTFLIKENSNHDTLFSIRADIQKKLLEKEQNSLFQNVVKRFFEIEDMNLEIHQNDFEEALYRHVYNIFDSDIKTLLSLLDATTEEDCQSESIIQKFSAEESNAINKFILWDDDEKNEMMFNIVSSCFEFCMMTVKKDNNSFSSMFKGKEFYLDTNIIFRLAGFNNNDRKHVMDSFIEKCKECGIRLKYTNFTLKEIEESLKWHVQILQRLLAKRAPVDPSSVQLLCGKNVNLDFYSQYVEWAENPRNELGDYNSFLLFLKKKIESILASFEFVSFESFNSPYREKNFSEICEEYRNFKIQKLKDVNEQSIKIDIENYLFIRDVMKTVRGNSFVNKNIYFITADHALIDWAESKMPGGIPDFVLPSVWYSIILKYHGRSNDDYSAFCQFLKVQERNIDEEVKNAEVRKEILRHVLELDESKKLKEEIIFDINQRLKEEEAEVEDVLGYLEESKQNVMKTHIDEEIKKSEAQYEKQFSSKISDIEEKHKKEIGEEREKASKAASEEIVKRQVEKKVEKKLKQKRLLRIGLDSLIVLFAMIALINVVLFILGPDKPAITFLPAFIENNEGAITLLSIAASIIAAKVKPHLEAKLFSIDEEKIKSKIERDLLE